MLPPPLRPGSRPRSLSMSALPSTQARSFGLWRCWESRMDPDYHRYNYHRSLQLRAKLLKNVQRRAKFEWDAQRKPLFNPRYASHWYGARPPRCGPKMSEDRQAKKDEAGGEEHELSRKEKDWAARKSLDWKTQMDAMREKIERDPYEAVFGKRFEPFWSYWFPREEYGLPPKKAERRVQEPLDVMAKQRKPTDANQTADDAVNADQSSMLKGSIPPQSQPVSYGYSSSTTWNSWTNKTQRTEWDSVSGEKRQFEYDPVSNRMVRIEVPNRSESSHIVKPEETKAVTKAAPMSLASKENATPTKAMGKDTAADAPAIVSKDVRKAIPIPQPTSAIFGANSPSTTFVDLRERLQTVKGAQAGTRSQGSDAGKKLNPVLTTTSATESPAVAVAALRKIMEDLKVAFPKPAGSTPAVEKDLQSLTAKDVRASMGRSKHASNADNIEAIRSALKANVNPDVKISRAELVGLFERTRSELQGKRDDLLGKGSEGHVRQADFIGRHLRTFDFIVEKLKGDLEVAAVTPPVQPLQTSLERGATRPNTAPTSKPLQSAVDRMQSKSQPEPVELDDAAAHESTEPIPTAASSLPKFWNEQADLLQSDRVKRTTSERLFPGTARWLNDMEARKAAYEKTKAATPISPAELEKTARLEKANALLVAEVAEQKLAFRQHEDRYAHKISSLRGELEIAYKQSSVHADEFRDQIGKLEARLASAQKAAGEDKAADISARYREKIRGLKGELDIAYKQSSVHADKFLDRIAKLEAELARATKAAGSSASEPAKPVRKDSGIDMDFDAKAITQGEGDFCSNVTKYADSAKWYKRPAAVQQHNGVDVQNLEQRLRDNTLARDVREIYEGRYGIIDAEHRQVKDGALEKALTQHENPDAYVFKHDGLEAELKGEPAVAAEDFKYAPEDYPFLAIWDKAEAAKMVQDGYAPKDYGYKTDGLEADLKERLLPAKAEDDGYAPKDYAYKTDGLEAELCPQEIAAAKQAERFQDDGLEVELKTQAVEKAEYASDVYEAEAQRESHEPLDEVVESAQARFEDLSVRRSKDEDSKLAPVQSPVLEDLETVLKKQAEEKAEYASDAYEAAVQHTHRKAAERTAGFEEDGLEAELKEQAKEEVEYASDAYEAATSEPAITSTLASVVDSASTTPSMPSTSTLLWHHPPLYKVLAYDSGNDLMSTATTSSWLTQSEEKALSITYALNQLYQPARFVPLFAQMQDDGFQVVHAGKDVLVFKKVQQAKMEHEAPAKITSLESHPVNPVDGTVKPREDVRPATGNFASPTGFVNYDPVPGKPASADEATRKEMVQEFAVDAAAESGRVLGGRQQRFADLTEHFNLSPAQHQRVEQQGKQHEEEKDDVDYKHYPRVKREEHVFSGTKRVDRRPWAQRRKEPREEEEEEEGEEAAPASKTSSMRYNAFVWATGFLMASAGSVYVVGGIKEADKQKLEEARARVLQAEEALRSGRWKLDGGFWKKGD